MIESQGGRGQCPGGVETTKRISKGRTSRGGGGGKRGGYHHNWCFLATPQRGKGEKRKEENVSRTIVRGKPWTKGPEDSKGRVGCESLGKGGKGSRRGVRVFVLGQKSSFWGGKS